MARRLTAEDVDAIAEAVARKMAEQLAGERVTITPNIHAPNAPEVWQLPNYRYPFWNRA